jgi:hypothetical protein
MDLRKQFVQQMMPYAIEASKRTGVDPRIIIGQAALESNYGRSAPGMNFFGIKSHGREGGQTLNTSEYGSGGMYRTADSFRRYNSMGESVDDYARFISENKRYAPVRSAQGLDAQLAELQKSGYATDPNYGSKVGSIARGIELDKNSYTPPQQEAAAPAPVYKQDMATAARWLGNKILPDQIDAPTPMTAEEVKTQNADLAQSAGYAKAAGGLLNLAKLMQEKPEPEEEMMPAQMPERRRVAFRPLPTMRGLL